MAKPADLPANSPVAATPSATPTPEAATPAGTSPAEATATYIVFLDQAPGAGQGGVQARVDAILRSLDAGNPAGQIQTSSQSSEIWEYLDGFTIQLTESKAQRLRALGGVQSVEADSQVKLIDPPGLADSNQDPITGTALTRYGNVTATTGEMTPWGIAATWGTKADNYKSSNNSNKYAFVIDTGVSPNTGDLNVDSSMAKTWVIGTTSAADDNGHGTHVAGTIGAQANGIGVIGVAPGATIVPLKVLGANGSGSLADAASAINYVLSAISTKGIAMGDAVVNLSLGAKSTYTSLDTAIRNAANKGLKVALAAGNNGQDVDSFTPARTGDHANVYTVSAVDSTYKMASWSNWDQLSSRDKVDNIDFAAPGVSVGSLGMSGQVVYLSGTSMASPHMAGLLLLTTPQNGGLVTPYFVGTADPFAIM